MPPKLGNNLIDVHEPAEPAQPQEQIQIEGQTIGIVETPHALPRSGTDKHSGLRDEIGSPGQHARGPVTRSTDPELTASHVDVATGTECDDCIHVP